MYTNEDLAHLSDEDKKKQRNSTQMEIIMLESDLKKLIAEKSGMEAEIRKIKYDEERLRVTLDEKKKLFDAVNQKINESEEEVKRLKKRLNFLV